MEKAGSRLENVAYSEELRKKDFPPLLQEAINGIEPSVGQNGFRKCGLIPWNPQAISLPLGNTQTYIKRTKQDINKIKEFLQHLENDIGEVKVSEFKSNEGEWSGPEKDLSLYNIWRKNQDIMEADQLDPINNEKALKNNTIQKEVDALPIQNEEKSQASKGGTKFEDNVHKTQHANISAVSSLCSLQDSTNDANTSLCISLQDKIDVSLTAASSSDISPQLTPNKQSSVPFDRSPNAITDPDIPSPFKRALCWPEVKPSTSKRVRREKIPAVITSPQNILYFKKKLADKQQKAEEQARRKDEREKKQKEKQEKNETLEKIKQNSKMDKINKRKKEEDSDTTTSDSVSLKSTDSEYDEDFETIDGDENEISLETVDAKSLKNGDFVLCTFLGGKRNQTKFIYLCIVQEKDKDIQVMGLKSTDKYKKEFVPNEKDISLITIEQILGRVAQPEILIRGEHLSYVFKKALPVKEM